MLRFCERLCYSLVLFNRVFRDEDRCIGAFEIGGHIGDSVVVVSFLLVVGWVCLFQVAAAIFEFLFQTLVLLSLPVILACFSFEANSNLVSVFEDDWMLFKVYFT